MSGTPSNVPPARRNNAVLAILLFVGGAGLAVFTFVAAIVLWFVMTRESPQSALAPETAPAALKPAAEPPAPRGADKASVPMPSPAPAAQCWWDRVPGANLTGTATHLRHDLPREKAAVVDSLGEKDDPVRRSNYQTFLKQVPELLRNPDAKRHLVDFVAECYVFEPAESHLPTLRNWLIKQIPTEDGAYPTGYAVADLDVALWALDVTRAAMTHRAIHPQRRDLLAKALAEQLGLAVAYDSPDLKAQVDVLVARRCYRKLIPTGKTALDTALSLRKKLLETVLLAPDFRDKRDIELAESGVSGARKSWPAYSALLRDCVNSKDKSIQLAIVDLYARLDPSLAAKFDTVFAGRWSAAQDAKLDQDGKVKAFRKALGVVDPLEQLAGLVKEARRMAPASVNRRKATLQETARLLHASTVACALAQKDGGRSKFDDLIAGVPALDQGPARGAGDVDAKKPTDAVAAVVPAVVAERPLVIFRDRIAPFYPRQKMHPVRLTSGKTYTILMVSPFDNYLVLHGPTGALLAQDDDSGGGRNALIRFTAPVDGLYRILATSPGGRFAGPYTVTVSELGGNVAKPAPARSGADSVGLVDQEALDGLKDSNPEADRIKAFRKIAEDLPADLTRTDLAMRPAQQIARYLLNIKNSSELEEVLPHVARFAKSRNMTLALADTIGPDAAKNAAEDVVGAMLQQSLRFGNDDNWALLCRRKLLVQAVDLNDKADPVSEIAETMHRLYLEQALLLGVDAAGLEKLARPAQVLESVVKHLSSQLAKRELIDDDKEYLDRIPVHLATAAFLAKNDLEHTALLQRVWIKVLAIHLARQHAKRSTDMRQVCEELARADALSRNVLEQLRSGEEKTLRLWALAHDLK